jgi:ABC-type proline/glycine betaine transport system permease subunit
LNRRSKWTESVLQGVHKRNQPLHTRITSHFSTILFYFGVYSFVIFVELLEFFQFSLSNLPIALLFFFWFICVFNLGIWESKLIKTK